MENFELFGNIEQGKNFLDSIKNGQFLFSFVISYTETCEIPGITFAGADKDSIQFTPPADAEYLHYGYCKTIDKIPMTPDGKPTPGLLTKTALESASIPHFTINAGSKIPPQLPFFDASMTYGKNILNQDAMTDSQISHAVDYGRIIGRSMASLTDCLVIGESIPGGTTTALAVLRALGYDAKVSSSIPNNPVELKNQIVSSALKRVDSDHPYSIVAKVGDPMIPFVAGMLSSASSVSNVMLAGGTQMAAVLAFASKIGFNPENTAIGTTTYITGDTSANFTSLVKEIADIPAIAVNPGLENSQYSGLKAFSQGFAKEGVGAGGSIISSMIKTGNDSSKFLTIAEKEYRRLFTSL
ncbi:MAG: TIGR00303 family protein [Nitrosopumilus sp.]|uniref:nicotinate mononucleotide-dependent phosphoribosyltransferase CobT n=1 Tax=Nitrosopumilus sp. TaxID=2024843 RepID=UPI00246EE1AC|nr:TIGR00303 family protein [Nitrosopumilus sp.]MDH5430462.1 TIGR00303 family protein [Nitrosopumilus sp.]MDH5697179.1 TIGR00303 family protein [Nitrosopumilus sp.]